MRFARCFLLLLPCLAAAADPESGSVAVGKERIDRELRHIEKDEPDAGLVVAETTSHEALDVHATRGMGLPPGVPPEHVLFEIGSITKIFTDLLLCQAVVEHRVELSDPIGKLLPASVHLPADVAAITLLQLATHRSGLPRIPANLRPATTADPYPDYDADQLYEFLSSCQLTPAKPDGTRPVAYSNLGVGLLGHILTRVYQRSYPQLLADKITRPLGLSDTVVTLDADQQARAAAPFSGSRPGHTWSFAVLAPCGAIHSTASDLLRLARSLMSPDSPLAPAWKVMSEPRAYYPPNQKLGVGVFISHLHGQTTFGHNGQTGNYASNWVFCPSTGQAMIILENNDSVSVEELLDSFYRPPVDYDRLAQRPAVPLPAASRAAYLGVYPWTGSSKAARSRTFTVIRDDRGNLFVRLTGQPFFAIAYAGDDRFFSRKLPLEIQFHRAPDGEVDAMTLDQNGRRFPAHRAAATPPAIRLLDAEILQDYAGTYHLAPGKDFAVWVRHAQLFVQLTDQGPAPIFCTGVDAFAYDIVDAHLTFDRGADGAVIDLVLHQNGRDLKAPRLP